VTFFYLFISTTYIIKFPIRCVISFFFFFYLLGLPFASLIRIVAYSGWPLPPLTSDLQRFTRARAHDTHWIEGWMGPDPVEKNLAPAGIRTPAVHPAARRYTDSAIAFSWYTKKCMTSMIKSMAFIFNAITFISRNSKYIQVVQIIECMFFRYIK
jgi:hypothetical protein